MSIYLVVLLSLLTSASAYAEDGSVAPSSVRVSGQNSEAGELLSGASASPCGAAGIPSAREDQPLIDPMMNSPEGFFSNGSGAGGAVLDYARFGSIAESSVNVYDLIRTGVGLLNDVDLSAETSILRTRLPGAKRYSEVKLTTMEDLLLELSEYPAQSELKQKIISKIDESNFDLAKLAKNKSLSLYVKMFYQKENFVEVLKAAYPNLINEAGALNFLAIEEARAVDQAGLLEYPQTANARQCSSGNGVSLPGSDPCAFQNLWTSRDAKRVFQVFREYFLKNRKLGITYHFVHTMGSAQISASWKLDLKGYFFKWANLSSHLCPSGVTHNLFTHSEAVKELK